MFGGRTLFVLVVVVVSVIFACRGISASKPAQASPTQVSSHDLRTAVFAGGCFWCMEPPFEKLPGVTSVESGYTGGTKEDPTYKEVSYGNIGHVEAVRITYDETKITYDDLLEVFWRNIDPTDAKGQFVDQGNSYLSAIFAANDKQRVSAEESKAKLEQSMRFDKPIVTPIRDASTFYLAEEYHQDYYKKNPLKYKYYRYRSGRDQFIAAKWGDDRKFKPSGIEDISADKPGRQNTAICEADRR